jgi:ATP-binding cassette subfamily C protein EexD
MAGLHELILRLARGYDTVIGESGVLLSAGQRQRIGLARALYGLPALVVLDEPNSNLDDAGDAALLQAIIELSNAGRTVFVVTHRTNLVGAVDKILVLKDGQVAAFGPRDAVLAALRGKHPASPLNAGLPMPFAESAAMTSARP